MKKPLTPREFLIQLYKHYDLGNKAEFEDALLFLNYFIERQAESRTCL